MVNKNNQSYSVEAASAASSKSETSNNVNKIQQMLENKTWNTLSIHFIETIFYKYDQSYLDCWILISTFLWHFRYGGLLTKHPLVSILACLVIPALSAIGLMNYTTENNPYKLWIPQVDIQTCSAKAL